MKEFVFYTKGVEYKSFLDEKGVKRYFVKGHITSGDLDLVNDIVTKSCRDDLNESLKHSSIKLDFDHETLRKGVGESDLDAQLNLTKIPLGKKSGHELDEKGNLVEFELNPTWKKFNSKGDVVMTFDEVWSNVKSGFYDAFSIAYVPVRTASKLVGDVKARMLDKINLINVALTGNPINPDATMTSVFAKSISYVSEFDELRSELKEIKNLIGDKKMEEDKKVPVEEVKDVPTEVVEVKEEKSEAPKEEEKEEEKKEEEKKPEEKSEEKEFVEIKSFVELKSKIEVLEKSLEKIDNILSKAVTKSKGAEDKSVKAELVSDVKSNSTLDLI